MSPSKNERIVGHELAAVLPDLQKPWFRTPHLLKLNLRIIFLLLSACGMGFDGSMMNGLQSLTTWHEYFNNPSSSLLGVTNAVLNIGPIVFGGVVAWCADRFGRRQTAQVGCIIIILSAILQTCSQNLGMFVAARFLIGVGIEFCAIPSPVLVTELAYPTHRSKLTNLYLTFFFVGAIFSSWTTYGTFRMNATSTWTWRIPSLLQLFIPSVQFVGLFFVPESPRWLVSKGRTEEARRVLVEYHAGGDENSPLVAHELAEIRGYVLKDAECANIGWTRLWKTKADRRRLSMAVYISFMSQLCGNGIISYYLFLILNSVGITDSYRQTLLNGILQIANWGFAIFGALMVDRLGRRKLWLSSVISMLVSFIIWTALSALFVERGADNKGLAIGVMVLVFYFQFSYSAGVTPLSFGYPTEILPFHARQKGIGLVYVCNSIANLFNSLVTPVAMDNIGWHYYLVYLVLLFKFAIVIYLFFPETKGHSLEQISDLFEVKGMFTGLQGKAVQDEVIGIGKQSSLCTADDKYAPKVEINQVENIS